MHVDTIEDAQAPAGVRTFQTCTLLQLWNPDRLGVPYLGPQITWHLPSDFQNLPVIITTGVVLKRWVQVPSGEPFCTCVKQYMLGF